MPDPLDPAAATQEPIVPDPQSPGVVVEVGPKPAATPAEDQLAAKIREDFEKLYGGRIKQLEDGYRAISRLNTKLQQQTPAPAPAPVPTGADKDEYQTLVDQGRWQEAVDKKSELKARAVIKEELAAWDQLRNQQAELASDVAIQEASKAEVIAKYPDLHPDTGRMDSVVAQTFAQVMNENPRLLKNPYGPLVAMQKMEALLIAQNQQTNGAEKLRQARAAQASPPASAGKTTNGKVTLTKEQKAFCDYHSVKYEDYAKTLQTLEATGGVET